MKLRETPLIDATAHVSNSTLGRYTEVGERTKLNEVEMGDYSYVVNDSDIAFSKIGKFCSIAAMTRINPGDHPMHRATQSHFTYRAGDYFDNTPHDHGFFEWRRQRAVTIGHDVWVGHGAIILSRRNIGIGAVVAAGAVVTKDVEPYTIVAGVPARQVKRRFSPQIAEKLMTLGWWDWSHARLQAALPDFQTLTIEAFIEKYQK